jgi:hypothetical protein
MAEGITSHQAGKECNWGCPAKVLTDLSVLLGEKNLSQTVFRVLNLAQTILGINLRIPLFSLKSELSSYPAQCLFPCVY